MQPREPRQGARVDRPVTRHEVEGVEVGIAQGGLGPDAVVERGQLRAQLAQALFHGVDRAAAFSRADRIIHYLIHMIRFPYYMTP